MPLAVITGASAGIGEHLARSLHADCYDLILIARRKDRLDALAHEFNSVRHNSARVIVADLSNPNSRGDLLGLSDVVTRLAQEPVDLLVNNAGFGSFGAFAELPAQRETEMIRLNVEAVVAITHAVLPTMRKRRAGTVVILSSIAGFQPLPFMATYAATKAFEMHWALALREELKDDGIAVLTICPGPTATEFSSAASMPGTFADLPGSDVSCVVSSIRKALRTKNAVTIPGIFAWLYALAPRILPRCITVPLAARVMRARRKRESR